MKTAFIIFCTLCLLSGCATTAKSSMDSDAGANSDAAAKNPDPFEKINRVSFVVSDTADRWLLKPVAKGYRFITPNFMEIGVSNFFSNLGEVPNIVNDILQWKWAKAGNDTGRLLLNSTFGIAGFVDVAKHAGLKENDGESLGQTLSHWGLPEGAYIYLPFFGPHTASDVAALTVSWAINPISYVEDEQLRVGLLVADVIDTRANLLDAESLISGDKYIFIRDAFLQRRQHLVRDGEGDLDSFEADFEGFDEDF